MITAQCMRQRDLQRVPMAPTTSTGRHKHKATSPGQQRVEPGLARFVLDPVKGADSLLRMRSKIAIAGTLAHPEFTPALSNLSLKATQSPDAAVSLARLAL